MTRNSESKIGQHAGEGARATENQSRARLIWENYKYMIGAFAGLLLAVVIMQACSKESDKPAPRMSEQVQSSPTNNTLTPTSAPNSVTPVPVKKQPKKTVRKRPAAVEYADKTSGVSFRYSRRYSLKSGDEAKADQAGLGPVPSNFAQPGGATLASVELPSDLYPGTDFVSAFFNVDVNRNITQADCTQFAVPVEKDEASAPSTIEIGQTSFTEKDDSMKLSDARYYHVFQNGACYEFALGLGTSEIQDKDLMKPVDHEAVFARLEKILTTVKIESLPVPEVAKETVGTPSSTSNQ